jgi:hypothetical protein
LSPGKRRARTLMASILLVAFVLRALIPPGFMPASDRPFAIEICWEGIPAQMLAQSEHAAHHHQHSGSPSHSEHCVFGTACAAGPISHLPLLSDVSSAQQLPAPGLVSSAGAVRLVHLPQPRAPPGRLS